MSALRRLAMPLFTTLQFVSFSPWVLPEKAIAIQGTFKLACLSLVGGAVLVKRMALPVLDQTN